MPKKKVIKISGVCFGGETALAQPPSPTPAPPQRQWHQGVPGAPIPAPSPPSWGHAQWVQVSVLLGPCWPHPSALASRCATGGAVVATWVLGCLWARTEGARDPKTQKVHPKARCNPSKKGFRVPVPLLSESKTREGISLPKFLQCLLVGIELCGL